MRARMSSPDYQTMLDLQYEIVERKEGSQCREILGYALTEMGVRLIVR